MEIDRFCAHKERYKICTMLILVLFMIALMNLIQNNILKLVLYSTSYFMMLICVLKIFDKRITSLPVIFSAFHIIFIGLGPIHLAIRKEMFLSKTYNIILLSYYVFTLTAYLVYNSKKYMHKIKALESKIKNKKNINYKLLIMLSYILIAVSIIAELIYLIKNFHLLFGGNMEEGRIVALQGNGILLYVMWFGLVGLCCLLELVLEKKFKPKIFMILYCIYGVMSILIGFRSRIITLFLFTILLYIQKRKVNYKKIMLYGVLVLIVTAILGVIRGILSGAEEVEAFLSISTLFENGAFNINHIMKFFPDRVKFQYGYTYLLNIIMLKPGPDLDFTLWLKKKLNMTFAGGGVTPTLVGELYINFGIAGTLIGFVLISIALIFLDEIYKNKKSTFNVVTIIWAILMSCRGGLANSEINVIVFLIVYNVCLFISSDKCKESICRIIQNIKMLNA